MTDESLPIKKIQRFLSLNTDFMSNHIAKNCIPWKNTMNDLRYLNQKILYSELLRTWLGNSNLR